MVSCSAFVLSAILLSSYRFECYLIEGRRNPGERMLGEELEMGQLCREDESTRSVVVSQATIWMVSIHTVRIVWLQNLGGL